MLAQHAAAFDGTADIALGHAIEAGTLVFFQLEDAAASERIGLVLVTTLGAELALAIGLASGSGFTLAGAAGAYIAWTGIAGAAVAVLFVAFLVLVLVVLRWRWRHFALGCGLGHGKAGSAYSQGSHGSLQGAENRNLHF